jgi:selenide,water dikinase
MHSSLPRHDVVLLGVGHTNAHVLRMWRMAPLSDCRLTCISDHDWATYSGMLPGTLAGLYPSERMQIDLVRLCAATGARLIRSRVIGLDREARRLLFDDRPPIPYDVLSVGIGSLPRNGGLATRDDTLLTIKPMQTFLDRLQARLTVLAKPATQRPLHLAVVGAGAGGVEICFCLPHYLRRNWPELRFDLRLIDRSGVLNGAPARTAAAARRELAARGVELVLGREVRSAANGQVVLDDGTQLEVDAALWATTATAPPLLRRLGLATDDDGFLLTRGTLQTTSDDRVFAVGDSGTSAANRTPKAGVFAVRQGPVLWQNIQMLLKGEPCVEYLPQRGFLSLLATGDRRAILSYKGMTFHASWCWKLKDYIDSRFMNMYQDYRPMPGHDAQAEPAASTMRCTGCGGKVGGSVLSRVLDRLEIPPSPHVLVGLEAPDDAAIVRMPEGRPVVATVDFFTAFLDDPYLVGRVAALNALSDVFAIGASPLAALAIATVPVGPERQQEQLLHELLAGGLEELRRAGATLAGGHTIEGPNVTIGFTVLADSMQGPPKLKGNLRAGDRLVLTKPLGTGILLAAHNQARLRAEWFDPLLRMLLAGNQRPAAIAHELGVQAITDVTGFGLAGHLLEMLRASGVGSELHLDRLPLLPGVAELVAEGVESTLAPANRAAQAEIEDRRPGDPPQAQSIIFDPQTSGGLLCGVAAANADALVSRLRGEGCPDATIIGEVIACPEDQRRLRIL